MKLYWITTENHAEDWFVVANTTEETATFHEAAKGYNLGNATAEMIVEIPNGIITDVGWPSEEVLRSCGARILAGMES